MKITPCLVGITFLFSSISMSIMRKNNKIFSNFMNLLNESQKKIYSKITYERMSIYVFGMILGLILGIIYLIQKKDDTYKFCKFLCIVYLVKLSFYYFYPKRPLMLHSLTTREQVSAWADIYSEMKNRWKKSLLIGFIGYIILGQSL